VAKRLLNNAESHFSYLYSYCTNWHENKSMCFRWVVKVNACRAGTNWSL